MTIKTTQLLGRIGTNKDVQPHELPDNAWSDGANMRFRNGHMERMKGEQQIFATPTQAPYWLQAYYQGGNRWWVHAGLTGIFADNGTTRKDITPTSPPTGAIDDRYTGGVLNGVLVANNGKDEPWYWGGGSGTMQTLTGWNVQHRAASIRPFKNVLVALNITKNWSTTKDNYPHMVKWSDVADPGTVPGSWDHTDKTKLAGEIDLSEEPSLMVDQLPLGDVNVIYKENSMYAMQATGGMDVFRFQRLPGNVGALARGCIASTPKGHVVLTHGDVILHSGQGPRSIINGRLRSWLWKTIDDTSRGRAFVCTNPQMKEVWVCFPELGATACTMAAVWNWDDDTWAIRTMANTTYGATGQLSDIATRQWAQQNYAWDDASAAWNENELSESQERLVLCSAAPVISAADVTGTRNGAAYTSFVERLGLTFGDASLRKTVRGCRMRIDGAVGTRIQIELGGSDNPETGYSWSEPFAYTVGQTPYNQIDRFASGRFIGVRVMSLDNQPWRVTSRDDDFVISGRY